MTHSNSTTTEAESAPAASPSELSGFGRVALVHDWLTGYRGGEKVLEQIARQLPEADLYTLFHIRGSNPAVIEDRPIHSSWMNVLPGVHRRYRWLLPFFPGWADRLDLRDYDVILSTSHCVAKGAGRNSSAVHICYCHTPMRYVWDRFDDYFGHWRGAKRKLVEMQARRLRAWDQRSADRVHHYIANSHFVRDRILEFYGLDEERVSVIAPPVDVSRFDGVEFRGGERYLVVSALVPYKRIDVAVEACARSGRPLDVAGTGPELRRLRQVAAEHPGADIRFLGFVSDDDLPEVLATHRAFLFPGVEDFGITVVEATAAGLPVIAQRAGGALDSVKPDCNGLLYDGATAEDLIDALDEFEGSSTSYAVEAMRKWASGFSPENFSRRYVQQARAVLERHGRSPSS